MIAADRDAAGLARLNDAHVATEIVDVTNDDDVHRLMTGTCERFGRLDLVFNNAGMVVGGDFDLMDTATWQRIVDVNLWGVVYGTRHAYALMREQGFGHIVNTASTAGVLPVPRSTAYAMTKHAVVGLSTSLRGEATAHGVRVSVAIPGLVTTNVFASATNLGHYDYQAAVARMPIKPISPDQAAARILKGVRKNKAYIAFPRSNTAIIVAYRLFPEVIGKLIARQI